MLCIIFYRQSLTHGDPIEATHGGIPFLDRTVARDTGPEIGHQVSMKSLEAISSRDQPYVQFEETFNFMRTGIGPMWIELDAGTETQPGRLSPPPLVGRLQAQVLDLEE